MIRGAPLNADKVPQVAKEMEEKLSIAEKNEKKIEKIES